MDHSAIASHCMDKALECYKAGLLGISKKWEELAARHERLSDMQMKARKDA